MIKRPSKFHNICYEWWSPYKDFLFSTDAQTCTFVTLNRSESFHATEMLLIPQTSNFALSLTLKTRTVIVYDLLPLASALTKPGNLQKKTKSKFKIAPCKTSICDRCVCKLIHLNQNCRS